MQKNYKIHLIFTGGTIDSYWNPIKDTTVPNEHSVIPSFIKGLKLYEEFEFTEICMKDSRGLNEEDVRKVCEEVKKSPHDKIIITHGTYTMPDTARYLEANYKNKTKTVIFTGSMIPLSGFSPSDGPFSLGYSIAKLQDLPPGIYVCMNGKVFSPAEVKKIVSEGRFSSIFNK
jgi:L-asparaginase